MLRVLLSWASILPQRLRSALPPPARVVRRPVATYAAQAGYLLVAVLAPACLFLLWLSDLPLRDNNEGLYAEIAREMLASGNYVVPHLNGVPYIEKPPLLYWLAGAAMAACGPAPGVVRLASALPMLALCLGLFQFCRHHLGPAIACYASVTLASMVPVALIARLVLFDPLLTALLGGWMLCYLHTYLQADPQAPPTPGASRAGAVLLGLAVMDKGAVALVLALGVAAVFLLSMRERRGWRPLYDPAALALFLAVVLPWHLLVAREQDGFAWFYVVNEHLLRFLGQRQPDDYHRGPFWFYLPRLLMMTMPWTPFLLLLARGAHWHDRKRAVVVRFCQAAVGFPLLFFSLSQAKADYYLVVCAPPLALWLALALAQALEHAQARARARSLRLAACWGAAFSTCTVLLVALPDADDRIWSALPLVLLILAWLALMPVATRVFLALRSTREREGALLAIVLFALPLLALAVEHGGTRAARDSSLRIAELLRAQAGPARQVFIYRDFEDRFASLPFYLGRPIAVVDSMSRDLLFGCAAEPGTACIDRDAFLRRSRAGPVAVAVLAERRDEFLALAGPGWRSEAVGGKIVFFNGAQDAAHDRPPVHEAPVNAKP
ncbi:glycosyltransferase family 39 protein [Massilia sp. 9096]|uniref:glycosyltransferase family 39 protein n=1 Tax=Massilia sp. 9096 TaxID=1500894 RepID=UPI000568CB27|nr:glycosyltransferase family 39 protein [Massilia sp. 9096]